jgi:uncharacterized protein (UPF0297 family)
VTKRIARKIERLVRHQLSIDPQVFPSGNFARNRVRIDQRREVT